MKEIDEKFYNKFNHDLPFIELEFGNEIVYYPQTVQLDFLGLPNLKDNTRLAIKNSVEYRDKCKNMDNDDLDIFIESLIKEKGANYIYNMAFHHSVSWEILEYMSYLVNEKESKLFEGELA